MYEVILPRRRTVVRGLVLAVAVLVCIVAACGRRGMSFAAEYLKTEENAAAGEQVSSRVRVHVDGPRFRIEDERLITVYDGTTLFSMVKPVRSITEQGTCAEEGNAAAAVPDTTAAPKSVAEVHHLRFWVHRPDRKKGAGGVIAGRDTVLYEAVLNRQDGEISVSSWTDARTGVVLKSLTTVYARRVESVLTRVGVECVSITYGAQDAALFARP